MSKKNRSSWRKINPVQPTTAHTEPQAQARGGFLPTALISERQLAANRAKAAFSTGPRTEAGLCRSSRNAVKHGLTGQTVLLDTDDLAEYQLHVDGYFEDLCPNGQVESDLVISIAETAWRLKRIPGLETGIYAVGELELAGSFEEHEPQLRASLIRAAVYLKYEKQLRNLHLQETRLNRRYEKEMKTLHEMQAERRNLESPEEMQNELDDVNEDEAYHQLVHGGPLMDKWLERLRQIRQAGSESRNGFEFSSAEKHPGTAATPETEAA